MSFPVKTPHLLPPSIDYGDQPIGINSHSEHQSFKRPRFSETIRLPNMPNLNNRARAWVPYKTKLCLNFRRGVCNYGHNCQFAHGSGDIRKLVSHNQELETIGAGTSGPTKLCWWWYNMGKCPYGLGCQFHHGGVKDDMGDLGPYRKSSAIEVSGGKMERAVVDSCSRAKEKHQQPRNWKTMLCSKWQTINYCPYGSKCWYAHGEAELLPSPNSSAVQQYRNLSSSKALGNPTKDVESSTTGLRHTQNQVEGNSNRYINKWKEGKKMIAIYADWINDDDEMI